jgi:hypothetical protein
VLMDFHCIEVLLGLPEFRVVSLSNVYRHEARQAIRIKMSFC